MYITVFVAVRCTMDKNMYLLNNLIVGLTSVYNFECKFNV